MSVRLYVEGGGDGKDLRSACRKGFRIFLEQAGFQGRMPRIVACGSRNDAMDDFRTGHSRHGVAFLLVDAEAPVAGDSPWEHLRARDDWDRPTGVSDEDCHLMVQIMESWFLADRAALADYFGNGFRAASLPGDERDVERIPKANVMNGLEAAARGTQKGGYRKGKHSFEILAGLDPQRVRAASDWAHRLLETLDARL